MAKVKKGNNKKITWHAKRQEKKNLRIQSKHKTRLRHDIDFGIISKIIYSSYD